MSTTTLGYFDLVNAPYPDYAVGNPDGPIGVHAFEQQVEDKIATLLPGGGAGTGDFSSNTSTSVDGEAVVFSGTAGKTGKRFTGTGLVKAASGVLSIASAGTDYLAPAAIGVTVQAYDGDLDAIAAISATSGLLKKTAANTWSLDTSTYLTANQTITLSGDVSGSGTTAITTAIGAGKVTNTMLAGSIDSSKLAAMTSAQLRGILSDENGSGVALFNSASGATLVNPIITNIAPGANFTLTQNSVAAITSEETGALVNTLYLKAGAVGIGTATPSTVNGLDLSSQKVFQVSGSGITRAVVFGSSGATFDLINGGGAANQKWGNINETSTAMQFRFINDAGSVVFTPISLSNSTGAITLGGDTLISASTANLYLKDTSTGFQSTTTLVITPQSGNSVRSTSFTSGLVGWSIDAGGNAEFANITARGAIRSAVFLYNSLLATSGTLGVFKAAAKLKSDVTVTASPTYGTTTFTIDAVDQDGLTHAASQQFVVNDILRLKDGLIGDTWFKVTAVSDQTTFWRYTGSIQAGSANVTYRAGLAIADYGLSGAGFIIQTADQVNSPYLQMATHAATFSSADASGSLVVTPQLRLGNLNGSYGYSSDIYGLGTGQYGAASKTWLTVDQTSGIRIGNNITQIAQWDTSGNILVGQAASGQSNTFISAGAFSIRLNTTKLFNIDTSGNVRVGTDTSAASTTKLFISNASQAYNSEASYVAGDILIGDNTSASNFGNIKITAGGTIKLRRGVTDYIALSATDAQFTNVMNMSGASAAIAIGSTPPTSASAGTGLWIDRTGLYGLSAGTVAIKFDAATLAFSTGAGNVIFPSVGNIQLRNNPAAVSFYTGTDVMMQIQSTDQSTGELQVNASTGHATASILLSANGILGGGGGTERMSFTLRRTTSSNADARLFITSTAGDTMQGLTIGANAAPNAMLDVRGNAVVTGNIITPSLANTASGQIAAVLSGQGTNDQGGWVKFLGGATGATVRGYIGYAHHGTFADTLLTGETADGLLLRGEVAINLGVGSSLIMTLSTGVVVGSPTGGDKGAGTINASAVYDDNVLLTDWMFDLHYDGKIEAEDRFYKGYDWQRLFTLNETRLSTETERRLPWMPSRNEFESKRHLGGMVSRLWQGQEQQQIYIHQLESRIAELEGLLHA